MYNQTEFYGLKDNKEINFLINAVNECTMSSHWNLTSGVHSDDFINFDKEIIKPEKSIELTEQICNSLKYLLDNGFNFDKIAFIDKNEGTVGLISLLGSIINNIGIPAIIIRPKKKLINDNITGIIEGNDKVIILSDVATSGSTIYYASEIIKEHGGKVPYAFVILDRLQGATESLSNYGIRLFSLTSIRTLNSSKKLKKQFKEPTIIIRSFGAKSFSIAK